MAPFGSRGSSDQQHPSDALRHFEAAQVFEIIRKSALSTANFEQAEKICTTFATWGTRVRQPTAIPAAGGSRKMMRDEPAPP